MSRPTKCPIEVSPNKPTSTPKKDPSAISGIIYIYILYISCVCPIFMLFTVSGVGLYPIYNHVYYQQLLYSFLKFQIPSTSLFPFHGILLGVPPKKNLPREMSGHRDRGRIFVSDLSWDWWIVLSRSQSHHPVAKSEHPGRWWGDGSRPVV